MSNKENKDLLFSEISFWYLFYSRRCKTKSIMRVQRKTRARDWLHFMSTSSCHLRNDYKPLLTCRSRSNQNKDVIKMRRQINLSCKTSGRFHLTWVFPTNWWIEFKRGILYQYDRIKDRYRWTLSDQLIRNSKFLTKITEKLSSG